MIQDSRYAELPPDVEAEGITIQGVLGTLRRRWPWFLLVGLPVGATLAAIVYLVVPAYFTAFATLRIAAREPRLVFDTADSDSASNFDTYRKTQIALLRSRFVLSAALRDPEIASLPIVARQTEPLDWLERELLVDSPNSPEILRIALAGDEPGPIAELVNAVRDAYLTEVVNVERQQRLTRLADLERIYSETEEKVRLKEQRLGDLARSLGTGDSRALTIRQQMALEYFGELQREYSRVRFDLMQEQVRRSALGPDYDPTRDPARERAGSSSADVATDRIDELELLVARFERDVRDPNHPSLVEYRRELAALKSRLGARTGEDGEPIVEDALAILERQETVLRGELDQYATLVDEIGTGSFDLETMKGDIEQIAAIAERVGTEMESLRIELQSPPRVQPLEEAEVPTTRDAKKRLLLTTAAGIGGFALVVALFVLCDVRSDHVSGAEQVGTRTGLDVLGSLPDRGDSTQGGVDWDESVDAARNLLLHRAETAGQRVLLVTAASRSEGPATVAAALAESLARSGRPTVFVDFDLRRPTAAVRFGAPAERGIADLVGERATLADVTHVVSSNLAVVAAGRVERGTADAIGRSGARTMFDALLERFEFVVVGSGPILGDATATVVARGADGAILALRRDVSQMPRVQEARRRLEMLDVPTIGAIVTATGDEVTARGGEARYAVSPEAPGVRGDSCEEVSAKGQPGGGR